MRLVKSALLLLSVMTAFIFFSFGQDTLRQSPQQESPSKGTRQSKEDSNTDFDGRMTKFQEAYGKVRSQERKARDPKMKADMDGMIKKMDKVNNDYNAMKNNTAMTEQQQQESRKRIQSEMKEIRTMHENMKQKYGDEMGGKAKKSKEQKAPPEESSPDDPLYN
jgi:hypothetical protein